MTIVFLPGTLTDERLFLSQTHLFPDSSVVDLRHSESLANMLSKVQHVPGDLHLIGFSMGGYVAQEFAVQYPSRVRSLSLIGSSALGYPPEEKELVLRTLHLIKPGVFKGITEKRLQDYLHPSSYQREDIKGLIQDMSGADAADVYLRQLGATLERRPLTLELSMLSCPITFIAGENDQIVKLEMIQESVAQIPGAQLQVIPECGHFIPLEKPDVLNRLLLTSVGSSA